MNYLQWNNAIIGHFFNSENDEKEVLLYFSQTIINEIGKENFPETEIGYIEDFYLALKKGVLGVPNDDYIDRIIELEKKFIKGMRSIDGIDFLFPPYFTYLLTFLLPFSTGEIIGKLNMNNFHVYAKMFFEEKGLVKDYDKKIKFRLCEIDHLWKQINKWLMDEKNFSVGYLEEIEPPGSYRKYVQKFEYHILLRKDQEERLSKVFDIENVLPGDILDEEKMRKLLITHAGYLRLTKNTKEIIQKPDDYIGCKIVTRALRFFKDWDGTSFYVDGEGRGYSSNRLVLCVDFNPLTKNLSLKHFRIYLKKEFPETIDLKDNNGRLITSTSQQTKEYSKPLVGVFKNLLENIELKNETYRNKYLWRSKDLLLFKKIRFPINEWIETPRVEYNCETTLIISKKDFFEQNLKEWFIKFNPEKSKFYDGNQINGLPEKWVLLRIENITQIPHDNIPELIPGLLNQKPLINFEKTFYQSGLLFQEKLPLVWVENTETPGAMIAEYSDGTIIPLEELYAWEINDNGEQVKVSLKKFEFTKEHVTRSGEDLKLKCGDLSYHRFLAITDFERKTDTEIEKLLPIRNGSGQLSSITENYFKGLEHFLDCLKIKSYLPWQKNLERQHVFKSSKNGILLPLKGTYDKNHLGNVLLHYISAKGKLSKTEFDNAVFSCAGELIVLNTVELENLKKQANYLRYELQDLGYIDYDSSKSQIIVNKSQLLIKPTESGTKLFFTGARDEKLINEFLIYFKTNKELEGGIEILIEEKILLPQAVFINLKTNNLKLAEKLANTVSVIFKKDNLNTQFVLSQHFGSMKNWEDNIEPVVHQTLDEGGQIFDVNLLEFIEKPADFDKTLSFVKFSNINGYKTVFWLWYQNQPFVITDQQYGIYLYLLLYRTMREDKYNSAKKEKGWQNCLDEYNEKEKAPKLTNVILYDKETGLLAVPVNCRLPKQISIAVSLLSGESKTFRYLKLYGVRYIGTYLVYKNVPSLFANNNVALLLGQTLIYKSLKN